MRSNIQSLERGFAIFEYIVNKGGTGVTELSKELQLNKSTVFSILKTLENLGYIYKDELTNTYAATFRLQSLAEMTADPRNITGYARPILQQLMDIYDETIHFVSARENSVVYLEKMESSKSVRIYTGIGLEMPLHCTSLGKVILADRTEEEICAYAERTGLVRYTKNSITRLDLLMKELEKVRQQGYAIDDEENQEGLYCVGVPVRNKHGKSLYALSLSMPKFRQSDYDKKQLVKDLIAAAEKVSGFF